MTDKTKRCIHFDRVVGYSKKCNAGICYSDIEDKNISRLRNIPCFGWIGVTTICEKYQPPTVEELEAQARKHKRVMDLFARDLSTCCEAPIDKSQVIQSGTYKNHGPRFCSKCGKLAYMV